MKKQKQIISQQINNTTEFNSLLNQSQPEINLETQKFYRILSNRMLFFGGMFRLMTEHEKSYFYYKEIGNIYLEKNKQKENKKNGKLRKRK